MSANISSVAYAYPIPKCFGNGTSMTISDLHDSIKGVFSEGAVSYAKVRDNLLLQLNRIFFGDQPSDYVIPDEDGHVSLADFIKKAPNESKIAELRQTLKAAETTLAEKEADLIPVTEALAVAEREEARLARAWTEGEATYEEVAVASAAREAAQNARDAAQNARDAAQNARDAAQNSLETALKKGFRGFSDCDESTAAYKFYARQIIDEINKLTDYINEAQKILNKWSTLSEQDLNSLVHSDVVRLECLDKFCDEIHRKFGTRYYYDFNEDNWKLAEDDYRGYVNPGMTYEQVEDSYDDYDTLYKLNVKCNAKTEAQKTLECFNELNLLDRLKYIQVYYAIKEIGYTNYVFPGSKEFGFPCAAEEGIEDTDARIAKLEKFYLGYLIDRDGPVNAFCSLYEVKVRALQETLNELQKRINALNVYLSFINRALDLLNQSQSDGDAPIEDGVALALTYLCGQKMYNLFEYNGLKYLVVPSVKVDGEYVCIQADEAGMRFLIGDSEHLGNCVVKNLLDPEAKIWQACSIENLNRPTRQTADELNLLYSASKTVEKYVDPHYLPPIQVKREYYQMVETTMEDGDKFSLPKELDVAPIDPTSVLYYKNYHSVHGDDDHKSMIESWTKTFNHKIQYINDAIQTVNTDVEQIRNKINTYQSQATTFRNRVHDVYVNTIRKVKS